MTPRFNMLYTDGIPHAEGPNEKNGGKERKDIEERDESTILLILP